MINSEELTKTPLDQKLSVQYEFIERPVKNLHKVRFSIHNSGTKTIIGKGPQKDILGNKLKVYIDSSENFNSP